jgi:hypothetical protein
MKDRRTAAAGLAVDVHQAVARHAESHIEQFGPNPDLEDRAKRHRAQARQLQRVIYLAKLPAAEPAAPLALAAPRERRETPRTRKTGDDGDSGESDEPPPLRSIREVLKDHPVYGQFVHDLREEVLS